MNRPPAGLGFGVNVAITVLATLAIGIGAYSVMVRSLHPTGAAWPTVSATPTSAPPPGSPTPLQPLPAPPQGTPRLAPIALSLVDPSAGWALLTSCTAPTNVACHYSVTATLDGGKTWGNPVRVGPTYLSVDGGGPRHVRFLNRLDGFVFGLSSAYATHDGGKSWNNAGLPAIFTYDIAIGGKTVWAVTSPCAKGVLCQLEVRASLDGGRTWQAPHSLPAGFSPEALVPFDSGVVMTKVPTGEMELTIDGGASWRAIQTQCDANPFRGYVATFDGKELWELCMGYPDTASNTADKALFVSEDGGRSWTARATSQPGSWLQPAGWPVWLVSSRAGVAFITGTPTALVTHDAGSTWTPVNIQLSEIHFSGPISGSGLDGARNIWVTVDGGEHWSQAGALPTEFSQ
jgi:photosystem II stability/assembly factor-like uncharacterized protein